MLKPHIQVYNHTRPRCSEGPERRPWCVCFTFIYASLELIWCKVDYKDPDIDCSHLGSDGTAAIAAVPAGSDVIFQWAYVGVSYIKELVCLIIDALFETCSGLVVSI
jgi:hypothetical protein